MSRYYMQISQITIEKSVFFKLKYIFIDGFLNGLYFKKQPRKLITNNKYDNKIISLMINILEVFFCLKLHRFI